MAGYPRVIGYVAGGYYPGTGIYGADAPMLPPAGGVHPAFAHSMPMQAPHMMPVHGGGPPQVVSPPWRPMMAPGSPPLGEGHVQLPLTAETFSGKWGDTTGTVGGIPGAPPGTTIIFSGRPQKPYKTTRLIIRGTKVGATAVGNMVGTVFVGTDLQQGELGFSDLESLGAANAFDTWVSYKQAEPGVWIRVQAQLTAYPLTTDFETYTVMCIGHYLH
jgi:hypothetical protein